MKHYMQPRTTILRETDPTPPSSQSPNPSFHAGKTRPSRKPKSSSSKENAPPSDPNSLASPATSAKLKCPLPPRPPNPLKRKLVLDTASNSSNSGMSDSGVQVVVRMRPTHKDKEEGEMIVQKISSNSLSINGQTFTFDSVADTEATQIDIFELVGAPLVENCMAGFNSSVFAYGQTGSGKTYTMWGPANAFSEESILNEQQGLTPRVFERLFARINEEQIKHVDKQLKYQCHCSLLEIYNEQITDLLDPNQRNLQIREDVKTGIYVENLTEECVYTMKDVTQILIKGFSNRRIGATSINAESSRSHTVFTCVVESRCKGMADGLSSFKTSRINLVDLAGSERQKLTGAAGDRLKEAGNINRSLSQLGNLINILAEISQTGKQRHIPYRDSRLTFLLQDSLGGNAKLAMVCAVSPTQSCKSETFSTLRFAQRAKAIKNKAVVNEVMQDDVNHLREVIRQLRDELHRIKENGLNPADTSGGHSAAWIRRSLNLIRSLNHPIKLPHVDEDGDEEMEIDEEAVENFCIQRNRQSTCIQSKAYAEIVGFRGGSSNQLEHHVSESGCKKENESEDIDINMEEGISEKNELMTVDCEETNRRSLGSSNAEVSLFHNVTLEKVKEIDTISSQPSNCENNNLKSSTSKLLNEKSNVKMLLDDSSCPDSESSIDVEACVPIKNGDSDSPNGSMQCVSPSLNIVPCDASPILKSPTPSVSPKINTSTKSLGTSSIMTASQNDLLDYNITSEGVPVLSSKSLKRSSLLALSSEKSKKLFVPTEHLAASIHHGLAIFDSHRQSSVFRRSSFRFPSKPAESKLIDQVCKVDAGVQTIREMQQEDYVEFVCASCKSRVQLDQKETIMTSDSSNLQLVPVDASESADRLKMQVPKAVEKVLAGAIRREMALEDLCTKQISEIAQLNRLVQQYKHERECNAIIAQTREDKILRLESLMDGILPTEDFLEEELLSIKHEYNILKEKYVNHPEILSTQIELKRVKDELENLQNFYDMGEREVLLEEIQDLRSQLQHYTDTSSISHKQNSLLQLTYSCEPSSVAPLSTISESTEESAQDKLEMERRCWTEAESKWISLSEELRIELEASRSLAEKRKQELETEKKCAEELKEAMQLAMEGHARMLEQYADLEEKHMQLLARHRRIQEGTEDVKKAASRAGVRGPESRFINMLAAEISALRVERERERCYLRDENKGLQAQLRDTAEAVQAAGELLVRLKEAEEAVGIAQKQAAEAKHETENAYKEMDRLRKKQKKEMSALNDSLSVGEPHSLDNERWREEFEPFYNGEDGELSKLAEPSSWFSGYDRCNI